MPSDRLFGPSLTTEEMAAAVSDEAWLRAMLRFEAALATAQARRGLIPADAAAAIAAACESGRFDLAAIGREAAAGASAVVPLVPLLRAAVGEHAEHVHVGTTSQDVLDSAMMLVARDGCDILLALAARLAGACAALAERHARTPLMARTLLQQALPTTFGNKAAGWLVAVLEARRRLAEIRRGRLAIQLGGPVGVLSDPELVADVAGRLDLAAPALPWQTNRVRVAELGAALAILAGAAAKIGLDLVLLAQDEVAEARPRHGGRSSAMAHKRNPTAALEARTAFALATAQAGVLLAGMAGEHERAAGIWQAEWPALTELLRLTAGAVARAAEALEDLEVDAERMRSNLGEAGPVPDTTELVGRALEMYREEGLG